MPNSVRVFQNITGTDAGAPALSGTAGTLIAVLDACLVNGYAVGGTTLTLDSLVVAGDVATCTKNPHGFTMLGTVGPVVRIAGATPAELNGEWRVTVSSASVFTFATTGIADQTATGTITAQHAPLGFAKAFSGTNKAAYRPADTLSSRMYLRVDDSGTGSAAYARVVGYEVMTDVDTGTGPFPTAAQVAGGGTWMKSNQASATARAWTLIGDSQGFMLFIKHNGTITNSMMFGDITSDHAGDAYRTLLIFAVGNTYAVFPTYNTVSGHSMPKAYTGSGTAIQPIKYGHSVQGQGMGVSGATYPHPGNNWFLCSPVEVWDSTSVARGVLPGVYAPLHAAGSLTDEMLQTAIAGLPGRTLMVKQCQTASGTFAAALDISGPWR